MLIEIGGHKKTIVSLSIAAIPVIAQYGITSYLAKFKTAYPSIVFNLEEREASTVLPVERQSAGENVDSECDHDRNYIGNLTKRIF